ncbi:MAG: alcohol dehydrogenase [Dehalococcoides mccartyi]|uniref:iron-containing alcohol dehydrogenase n=1 Tax=Dehalococcoides mccartyi TaxID=61435 RepID=UPI000805D056|nr:iron-containing alcohol dehydrogenase [Dehalococcoides mccartyi]OBW62795.1 MAG: alcohol dehydrogenase [Dehalococcoides mccartyi]
MITTFDLSTRIIFGVGSISSLNHEASLLGRHALLVTGKGAVRRLGILERALFLLKEACIQTTLFDHVEPNPRSSTVDEGIKLARAKGVDLIIALGGGSAMDAAKAIAFGLACNGPVWDYIQQEEYPEGDLLPLIMIPTVAASGSEANGNAVISNWEKHEKRIISDNRLQPKVSLVDPLLTLSLPPRQTAQGGVDIFCHIAEPYLTAADTSPLRDGMAELAMRLVVEYLPKAVQTPHDLQSRTQLSWLSTIACSQFMSLGGKSGNMTMHGLEHALSGYYDIAHADGLAALLPAYMRNLYPVRRHRIEMLGEKVFGQTDGILAVENWLKKNNIDFSLKDLGVAEAKIEEIAAAAIVMSPWVKNHPGVLDKRVATSLYSTAFN